MLPALCLVGAVGWQSSLPPNGRPVLLLDVLGRGGLVGSVLVVPVALGRHGTLWRCVAPSRWGVIWRCLAFLLVGRIKTANQRTFSLMRSWIWFRGIWIDRFTTA